MMEDDLQALAPREAFLRAKVEHYISRAEEYASMARFPSALRTVETVLSLDPRNKTSRLLRQSMADHMARLRTRTNGSNGDKPAPAHRKANSDLVMVVDQDEPLLTTLTSSLRRSGYEVACAGSYDEAAELFNSIRPDLVLSEVNFDSGPRGFDLYLWMKTNSSFADIPFLFLAARLDRDLLIAGKRFGVDDFILKPVDDGVVVASVQNCLARRRTTAHT